MMGRTHAIIGLLTALVLFPFFDIHWALFIPLVVLASYLPDVDHENSKINRVIPLTRLVPKFFKHRGFFHSAFPPLLIYLIAWHYGYLHIGIPITIGYLSHLISDSLTKLGCNFLHPISNFRISGFVTTGGKMEYLVFAGAAILSLLVTARALGILHL
ncbi:hypothetical protein COV18_03755 [Candidatus Woesearchaeota archaeon CG10_big_fil_rev_8_21_14_0_10_37_12]|nr:MAG: hypothetical protein COV18_03755 [Candidatus Woesearchaeota archaeon CG10_big_fil_rev_8_21_14_0_10_37_12]